jgi:YSIRK-targeted surface antigen transcriptional regulator
MKTLSYDLEYLCGKMADMSGQPIRIYKNGQLKHRFSSVDFVVDPVNLYINNLLERKENVSYFITERYEYYGIIRKDETVIIIGPGRDSPLDFQQLHDLAFELNITNKDYAAFSDFILSIIPLPLESMIQMMCSLNHILNHEKLYISDFHLKEVTETKRPDYFQPASSADIYKNYNIEKHILDIIRSGDTEALQKFAKQAPTVRSGKLSDNLLRQRKNTFVVTTTLATRASIESGLKVERAFQLSDFYIQKCENCSYIDEVNYLYYEMILTFTKEVENLKKLTAETKISRDVYHYILEHISEPIKTEDIAKDLYLSRSHLSTLFKKETEITLNSYINRIKTEKAKELLTDNSKSINLISDYLGYSSSSHFNRVFKTITGLTPSEYRKKK